MGYENEASVFFYRIDFDEKADSPLLALGFFIDDEFHVKLHDNGLPVPLLRGFTTGRSAKLVKYSMLENLLDT